MRGGGRTAKIVCAAAIASVLLGGCSTMHDLAGLERAGPQGDGGYILTSSESSMDCRALAERIDVTLEEMAKAAGGIKAEREQLPSTVAGLFARATGGADDGLKSARRHREGAAHVRALAAEQARKGCASADVEPRIAATRPQDV